jgi:hypothetical protein
MELARSLIDTLGGTVSFWQVKICDIAEYTEYHADLKMWEVNRAYEVFMGLPPEYANNLRKKKSLAKHYLLCLSNICKQIDRSKPAQEDLLKIDECYKKLKKAEEKYCAFMEEVEGAADNTSVSTKGKNNAKNTLFMFLKPKEEKVNTLTNYNFKFTEKDR